jgi:hypothetical protein
MSESIGDPGDRFIEQCEQDYLSGEITAVALSTPGTRDLRLVFAVTELMPPWLEQNPNIGLSPKEGGYPRAIDLGAQVGKLHVQRWRLSVGEAIRWYRGSLTGSLSIPGYSKNRKPHDVTVAMPPMEGDPEWPSLCIEIEKFWGDVPFWGRRPGGSRWHRLLPKSATDLFAGWPDSDIQRARARLREEIHIDLLARSVLWGSCHLVLPNPLYGESSFRVRDDWRSVELELRPHPGRTVENLELVVSSRRAWGKTAVTRKALTSPRVVVPLPEGVECTSYAILCPTRGLLEESPESPFWASIEIEASIISEERRVSVPERSKKHRAHEYRVGVAGPAEITMTGDARPGGAVARLIEDDLNVKAKKTWDDFCIRWLDKDVVRGRDEIRTLVKAAKKSVDFIDPYFGVEDLLSFPLATTIRNLPVRILTSADFCGAYSRDGLKENGENLFAALESIREQTPGLTIDIKVMPGSKSPVHDRFMIIDGWVWVLGASLNEFGERGTLLLRLPREPRREVGDSASISISRDVFEGHWLRAETESLGAFVARRTRERRSASFDERLDETIERCKSAYRQIKRIWRA